MRQVLGSATIATPAYPHFLCRITGSGIETMIRKMTSQDIERVGEIWLETSIVAHDFVSADFWRTAHKTMTEELLPHAEGYVHVGGERIDGFTVIAGDFIHCLFVEPKRQRGGIGTVLLSHLKESHQGLRLHAYQKNLGATRFYESHGFRITGEATCPHTECAEFKMEWRKKPKPEN